jgi:transcriptional regulator with XRE-family HTH domain
MVGADQAGIDEQIRAFGDNLRRARLRSGFTQVRLSAAAPLDRAAISRLECGERAPDLPTLLRICSALGVEPTELLSGIGPKTSPRRRRGAQAVATDDSAAMFGANLKWARNRAGISQERLALDAKVDRAAISVYENGGREPNLRTVLKLSMKLGVRPSSLLEGIGRTCRSDGSRPLGSR